jgi:hypothetical protein
MEIYILLVIKYTYILINSLLMKIPFFYIFYYLSLLVIMITYLILFKFIEIKIVRLKYNYLWYEIIIVLLTIFLFEFIKLIKTFIQPFLLYFYCFIIFNSYHSIFISSFYIITSIKLNIYFSKLIYLIKLKM